MISIIVAIAEKNAIGKNNDLLCHLPNDLKRFKKITTGHKIIMGRNTFVSLPVKPLPNRTSIVISHTKGDNFNDCLMAYSIDEAVNLCGKDEECFVIGGGMIYTQFLPIADRLYLTKIHHEFDADIFFPEINYSDWQLIEEEKIEADEKNPYSFSYLTYERK
jgi:dihydrofolate reductase